MRVLLGPDLHCGQNPFVMVIPKPDPEIWDPDLKDGWLKQTGKLINVAKEQGCSLALFPGDLFCGRDPDLPVLISLFAQLEAGGTAVVAITGNWDSPRSFVKELHNVNANWGISTPAVVHHQGAAIICYPYTFKQKGTTIIRTLRRLIRAETSGARYRIVLAHYSTDASRSIPCGPVLPFSELRRLPVDLILLGHAHEPQRLCEGRTGPVVFHTGSFFRRGPKWFAVYDLEKHALIWEHSKLRHPNAYNPVCRILEEGRGEKRRPRSGVSRRTLNKKERFLLKS